MTRNNLKYNKKVKCDGRTDGRTDKAGCSRVHATKNAFLPFQARAVTLLKQLDVVERKLVFGA